MPDPTLVTPLLSDISRQEEKRSPAEIVASVWQELGKRYRPLRRVLIVRTDPQSQSTPGGILLTQKESDLYTGMPHMRVVKATVLAAGPKASTAVGARVCFQRLHFAWFAKLEDKTLVGTIEEEELVGYLEDEQFLTSAAPAAAAGGGE